MTSLWVTTSKGEIQVSRDMLQSLPGVSLMSPLSACRFPTIYFAPVGRKDEPVRYQVRHLSAYLRLEARWTSATVLDEVASSQFI